MANRKSRRKRKSKKSKMRGTKKRGAGMMSAIKSLTKKASTFISPKTILSQAKNMTMNELNKPENVNMVKQMYKQITGRDDIDNIPVEEMIRVIKQETSR